MEKRDELYWVELSRRTLPAARGVLARAGVRQGELRVLAEEVAQEALLELLERHGAGGRPEPRSWRRAIWRCAARAFRGRQPGHAPLVGEIASGGPTPDQAAAAGEAKRLLEQRLGPRERELLQHLAGGVEEKPRGIHRSALAHELGVSRRTLGRRLDLLGRLIRQTADDALLRR